MELQKNQQVLFENGHKADFMEARWSEKHQAFYYASDETDEEGKRIVYFSTNVIEKEKRKTSKFVPGEKSCTVRIMPLAETEKAYQIEDGSNGKIGRSSVKEYYKWIAKSVCYVDENGAIFAPAWAV